MGKRDYYFDNAKFILILLVVFGHSISPLKDGNGVLFSLYKFIYLFHMPAFILIAGYFTKGFDKPGYVKKVFKKTLIPYFIFQVIYNFYYFFTGYDEHFTFSLLDPHWSLWFLISLFSWHLMIIPFSKMGKYGFPAALVLGIAVGYFSDFGSYLSIERTFIFFPLFYLGYLLKGEHFAAIRQKASKFAAIPLLITIFAGCYFIFPDAWKDWLLGSSSYAAMGVDSWEGGLYRLIYYAVIFVTTFAVLTLIPEKQMAFTNLGGKTLYIYLLHGFFVKTIDLFPSYENIQHFAGYLVLFAACIALCFFLASRPVRTFSKPLIELKLPKLKQNSHSVPR
ncbi:fucose 4-O-acetylase-like acetyltransferase [Scopulibacillus darangshiensis]|uniref:Fucose 4-O-acetylase-like acetyltransferase n=1 Tax=Scopulibacillus darangshiensis TaxID=442528 RepID=A0A4R2P5W0_9BACL|nr:acyltransferase family protein [Scopulibacillus darangshiensis]TCP30202.1 fucose 4-O-acetylase-like acetyltransferase [Scopulibacillus darangshiensis]